MAHTFVEWTGDGSRTLYPVQFDLGHIRKEYVYVYQGEHTAYNTQLAYTWVSDSQIELTTPIEANTTLYIRRIVDRNALINDYQTGALLVEESLDDSYKQTLAIVEEITDGFWATEDVASAYNTDIDLRNHKIINLVMATAPDANDVANVAYVKQLSGALEEYYDKADEIGAAVNTIERVAALEAGVYSKTESETYFLHKDADDSFSGNLQSTARDKSIVGHPDTVKTDQIWTIGPTYANAVDGTDFGTLSGLAYKHTDNSTGGTMAGGHQIVWCDNGAPRAAMGYDGLWGRAVYDGLGTDRKQVFSPNNEPSITDIQGMTMVAMVNFDGVAAGTPIRGSLNVKRVIDNGVGDYTIEFTNPVSIDKRAIICGQFAVPTQTATFTFGEHVTGSTAPTVSATTEIRVLARRGANIDISRAYVMVFGELV